MTLKPLTKIDPKIKRLSKGLNAEQISSNKMSATKVTKKATRWNEDKMNKAAASHSYINAANGGKLSITGAQARWNKPETAGVVYVSTLRIAGTPTEIRGALAEAGYAGPAVENALVQAYTPLSVQGALAGAFAQELAQYDAYKKQKTAVKKTKGHTVYLTDLDAILADIKSGAATVVSTAPASPKKAKAKKAASPKKGRTRDLATRIRNLKDGKVLDASGMDIVKGTGIKSIDQPKSGSTSKKVGVGRLRLVSNDNAKYAAAIALLNNARYKDYPTRHAAALAQVLAGAAKVAPAPAVAVPSPAAQLPVAAMSPVARALSPRLSPQLPSLGATSPQLGGLTIPVLTGQAQGLPTVGESIGSPAF